MHKMLIEVSSSTPFFRIERDSNLIRKQRAIGMRTSIAIVLFENSKNVCKMQKNVVRLYTEKISEGSFAGIGRFFRFGLQYDAHNFFPPPSHAPRLTVLGNHIDVIVYT